MSKDFGEVLTAMITPFDEQLEIDYQGVRDLALYLIENGSDGLLVLGTTSESPVLTKAEKIKVLENVIDVVGDKTTVIANTGSYSTSESIEMTKNAEKIGADGIMAVVPYYNKPPQDGLYNHFKMIALSTSLPVMIYNVPGRTSRNIEAETVEKLSKIENIVAIKEASGNMGQISNLARIIDDNDFYIYSGDDNYILPILSVGGHGVVSVASHLVGKDIKKMISTFKKGNVKEAININIRLGEIFNGIFLTTNPIPVKAALNLTGKNVGGLRPPLLELDNSKKDILKNILKRLDLI